MTTTSFGQILEVYNLRGERWLTIWDLASSFKFTIPDALRRDFMVGQLVRYEQDATDRMTIEDVSEAELPKGTAPVVPVRVPAGEEPEAPRLFGLY